MRYYTIQNGSLLIADNLNALARFYSDVQPLPEDYEEGKYIVVESKEEIEVTYTLELNPDFEAEKEAKEKERVALLNLTGADVERGIYKAKGMDFEDIIAMVTQLQPAGLDVKALKIELKANNFYRGNPYVNAVGGLLGFTSEQLDKFFEDGDYKHLLPPVEPEEPTEEEITDGE